MAFISASQIAQSTSIARGYGRRGNKTTKSVRVGMTTNGLLKDKSRREAITIRFTQDVARDARILPNDRVDILFDRENGLGLIKRINKGGYAATIAGGLKQADIKPGEYYAIIVKFTRYKGMPIFDEPDECENVTITDEGILFALPPTVMWPDHA